MIPSPSDSLNHNGLRWDRPLLGLLVAVPLVVLLVATFVPLGATRIYSWPWSFYVPVAYLAPWLWIARTMARGDIGWNAGWWAALPLGGALVTAIAASDHPRVALEAALPLLTPLLSIPFVAAFWRRSGSSARRTALRAAGAILTALAATSLVMWWGQIPEAQGLRWLLHSRNPHPLGHWNYTGGLALLTLPITGILCVVERGSARIPWIASTILAIIQLLSSGSRGAVLGLLAALILTLAMTGMRRLVSIRVLAWGAVGTLVAATIAIIANPRFREALDDPSALLAIGASEQQRLGFLLTGIAIVQAHPWTGVGPGMTPYHYPMHRADIPGGLENSFQLHCGPVQWGVDTGMVGGIAALFSIGVLIARVWSGRRRVGPTGAAAAVTIVGYGTMWLTDYQLDAPIFPLVLAAAVAVLLSEAESTDSPSSKSVRLNRWVALAPLAAALGTAVLLTPAWLARSAFSSAWVAKDAGNPTAFLGYLRDAARADTGNPYYANHLARALAGIAARLPAEPAQALRGEARTTWERSLHLLPAQDHPWLNLGWLALANGDDSEAAMFFQRAAAIQPRRSGLWYAIAVTRLRLGDTDAAARALARESRINPEFILSPIWNGAPYVHLRPVVIDLIRDGWQAQPDETEAGPAPEVAIFARWWWLGEIPTATSNEHSRSAALSDVLRLCDDRSGDLPVRPELRALAALRGCWRHRHTPVDPTIAPDLAAAWAAHVEATPTRSFSELLRTFNRPVTRRVQRHADGIMFRQVDGDPLSDLTEIPANSLARMLSGIAPEPAIDEFLNPAWTARIRSYQK